MIRMYRFSVEFVRKSDNLCITILSTVCVQIFVGRIIQLALPHVQIPTLAHVQIWCACQGIPLSKFYGTFKVSTTKVLIRLSCDVPYVVTMSMY